ncbi:MAG: hypothetical protein QM627_08360 [Luteolibacter sp.]
MFAKPVTAALLLVALTSCQKKEQPSEPETTPLQGEKVIVPMATPVESSETSSVPTPPEEEIGMEEPVIPESEVVIGEEASPSTPGEHLDRAIRKTGEGIQRLGDAIERKAEEKSR